MTATSPRYLADPADALISRDLDGITALYHRPSGQTHLLVEPAPLLLSLLANGGMTLAKLTAALRVHLNIPENDDISAVVAERLAELERSGLVWRA